MPDLLEMSSWDVVECITHIFKRGGCELSCGDPTQLPGYATLEGLTFAFGGAPAANEILTSIKEQVFLWRFPPLSYVPA